MQEDETIKEDNFESPPLARFIDSGDAHVMTDIELANIAMAYNATVVCNVTAVCKVTAAYNVTAVCNAATAFKRRALSFSARSKVFYTAYSQAASCLWPSLSSKTLKKTHAVELDLPVEIDKESGNIELHCREYRDVSQEDGTKAGCIESRSRSPTTMY
jgi:hypothetical protein